MAGVAGACAAIEAITRSLAREWGQDGVRVVCLRPTAIPETRTIRETIGIHARTLGISPLAMAASIRESSLLKRDPTLAEVVRWLHFSPPMRPARSRGRSSMSHVAKSRPERHEQTIKRNLETRP